MSSNVCAVVGAINIDIWGRSFEPLIAHDSNPGSIRVSFGGVGHNIAANMSLMGLKVHMLTAIGRDMWEPQIIENCAQLGICLENIMKIPVARNSSYLCISGPDGDMELAICDTDIAGYITPEVIEQNIELLNRAELVVFDGNLTFETIDCLTRKCTAPLFADPVSVSKAKKLKPFLHRIHTLKPNLLEAEYLTGCSDAGAAAQELVYLGVKRAFVSDGAAGIAAAHGLDSYHIPCCTAKLVNATGGGDAVMAAICRSFVDGLDIRASAEYAMAAGAIAVESPETINPEMSHELIVRRLKARNN